MKREKIFLNSKIKILMASALLVIVLITGCIWLNQPSEENVRTASLMNIGKPYSMVAETEYEFDNKTKTISFSENINRGSFVISNNPNGIVEGDKWVIMSDEKTYNVESLISEETSSKVYIYYMAGATSTITDLDSSATTYTISSSAEFAKLATKVNEGNTFSGKTIVLMDNVERGSAGIIGTSSNPFSGTFDGAGYTISGVNISETSANTGVFGYVTNGTIENITVRGTLVKGGDGTGALVGYMSGTILNCKNKVDAVNGTQNVGGLVGKFSGTIKYCENYGEVATTSERFSGGIVGSLVGNGEIINCTNKGTITAKTNDAGGIIATSNTYSLTLKYCVNSGMVKSTVSTAGGIVASIQKESENNVIENCKNIGVVTSGKNHASGILAWIGKSSSVEIRYCINEGAISATEENAGGIMGYGHTDGVTITIENCFNSNDVLATQGVAGGILGIGVGQNSDSIKISQCGNAGNISIGTADDIFCAGGIAGNVGYALIESCYNVGDVVGYGDLAGIAVFKSSKTGTVKNCYVSGMVRSIGLDNDAGVVLVSGMSNWPIFENNYWKGVYYDTTSNNMYRKYKGGWTAKDENVTDFNVFSGDYTENNYELLENTSDWALKWQVPPTILSNPYDVYQAPDTTATLETIVYGATNYINYQWYVADSASAIGTTISGANDSKHNVQVETSDKYYYCVVTGVDYANTVTSVTTQKALVKSGLNAIATNFDLLAKSITITTTEELLNFAELVNAGYTFDDVEVLLGANVSASSLSTPIGGFTTPFKGVFDGRGYVISDVTLSGLNYIGLFGCVENATIKNLTVSGTSISGTNYVGGIVGYGSGILENLESNISITSTGTDAGGIAGEFNGTVRYCKNMGTVTGVTNVGGIVGQSLGEITVFNCENQGNVTSTGNYTAGILAKSTGAVNIKNCVNNGEISATKEGVGGILGYACFNSTSTTPLQYIGYCRNNKAVNSTGGKGVGGIAGEVQSVKIEYCINNGTTSGTRKVGGIVGYALIGKNIVQYCQNHNEVSAQGGQIGGIVGQMEGLSSTYYAEVLYSANKARVLGWQGKSSSTYKDDSDYGGIVGYMIIGHVEGCYLLVTPKDYYGVYGRRYVSGIVGAFDQGEAKNNAGISEKNTVKNCYATGQLGIYDGGSSLESKSAIANWVWYSSYPTDYAENNYFNGTKSSGKYYARWVKGNYNEEISPTVTSASFISNCGGIYHKDTYNLNNGKGNSDENWVLTWEAEPIVIRNPFNVIRPVGTTATLDLVENGALTEMSYQWYVATKEDGEGTEISNATASTFVTAVQSSAKWYYCKITGVNSAGKTVTTYTERAVVGNGNFVQEISECTVTLEPTTFIYNGTAQEPTVTIKNGEDTLEMGEANDYIVSFANNINAGIAKVTITGIGDYSGEVTETFEISKKNVETKWGNKIRFEYNGKSQAPTATAETGVSGETITLERTTGIDADSYKSTAKIKSVTGGQGRVANYSLSNATKDFSIETRKIKFVAKDASKIYDGTALTWKDVEEPGYEIFQSGLAEGHTAEVSRNGSVTDVGTGTHSISNVSIKQGSTNVTKNYKITKTSGLLTVNSVSGATLEITFDGGDEFTYNGYEHKPSVTVTVKGKSLSAETDYDLSYSDNINAGNNAKVIATGKGNYEGSNGNATFTINQREITIKTKSKSKVYNGKYLKYSNIAEPRYTVSPSDGIADRDVLSVTTGGQILNVGSTNHEIQSYEIKVKDTEEDSSTNYKVNEEEGKLTIKPATIVGSVTISGEAVTNGVLTANISVEPDDCARSLSWWYEDPKTSTRTNIEGATNKTFEIADDSLIGKIIGVTVTFTKLNYNSLTVSALTSDSVTRSKNKNVLMERIETNLDFAIGAKRASERTEDSSYLNYTANKIASIKIINTTASSAPTTFEASWDVSKDYGAQKVIAYVVANGSMYDLYIASDETIEVSSGRYLFANYTNCASIIGIENLNTSKVTDMTNMFADCSTLNSLNVQSLNTSANSSMEGMFKNCSNLETLNVSGFKTIRTTSMKEMFAGCSKLKNIDAKKFKTVNVKDMSAMFKNCTSLETLDVSRFDTTNVENFASMFNGCSSLTSLNLKRFTTTKAKSMGGMFKDCTSLTVIDLSSFSTIGLDGSIIYTTIDGVSDKNLNFMFDGCTALQTVVLGENFTRIDGTNMFRNCTSLKRVIAQSGTVMAFSADTGINKITNAKIYITKNANLSSYSSLTNYSALYEAGRVRAILEIVGDNPANVTYGTTYVDEGATVAGWDESEKAEYEKLGYTLTTTGLPINTEEVGKYHVIYTLKYSTQIVDTVTN